MRFRTQIQPLYDLGGLIGIRAEANDYRYPVHFHETFVIELVHKGVDWCSAREQMAGEGDVFFHFPYSAHSGGNYQQKPLEYSAIYPSIQLMRDTGFDLDSDQLTVDSMVLRDRSVSQLAKAMFDTTDVRDESMLLVKLFEFNQQVTELLLKRYGRSSSCPGVEAIYDARRFLDQNFPSDIRIAELGEVVGLSDFHLIRQFRKTFGITPRQYLISKRVARATELVKQGHPIASVAFDTGFCDQSHLTRCFRRVNGFSPGQISKGGV